jgi:hypothetical protein
MIAVDYWLPATTDQPRSWKAPTVMLDWRLWSHPSAAATSRGGTL